MDWLDIVTAVFAVIAVIASILYPISRQEDDTKRDD